MSDARHLIHHVPDPPFVERYLSSSSVSLLSHSSRLGDITRHLTLPPARRAGEDELDFFNLDGP